MPFLPPNQLRQCTEGIKYTAIVAYTFLNVCAKIHQFLSRIKKDADKRKSVPFICLTVQM